MVEWEPIAGEEPTDPSGLRDKTIGNRPQSDAHRERIPGEPTRVSGRWFKLASPTAHAVGSPQ